MSTTNGNNNGQAAAVIAVDKKAAREEYQAKRFVDLEQDNKKQLAIIKQHGRQLDLIKKEKDNLQQDYNKAVLAK